MSAPHLVFVPLTGLRVREERLLELGMTLPALADRAAAIGRLPALGLLTLAGLTPPPWSCSYVPVDRVDEAAVEAILARRPTLVAISALSASIGEAYKLSDRLRAAGVNSVLGGLHVTACPDEAQGHARSVVVGEGEPVWPTLLSDAARGELRPRYQTTGAYDLARSPPPRLDLLPGPAPRMTLQTQRGCPLACDFCAASRLLGPFRVKPLRKIEEELEAIRRLAPRPRIELADDNTFLRGREAEALCDLLGGSGARWFSETDWRMGERPELLRRLRHSGCVQLLIGVESLVFRYPGMGGKQAELERILDSVRAIQEHGVAVNGCFIVGAEGETRASLDRLAAFLVDSPLAEIQLTLQTPFPGTALHARLKREERLLPVGDWSRYTLFDVTYQPDSMTPEELSAAFTGLLTTVFAPGPTARRAAIRRRILKAAGRAETEESP